MLLYIYLSILSSFIHPGAEINFQLHKRKPLNICIERADVSDTDYWGGNVPARAGGKPEIEIEVTMVSVALEYDSVKIERVEAAKLMGALQKYYWDMVVGRAHNLSSANLQCTLSVVINPGTAVVFLAYAYAPQTLQGAKERSWMLTRFRFPPNLKKLTLSHSGADGVMVHSGFENLGTAQANSSHSLRALHAEMVRKKLYSKSFDSWVPPHRPTARSANNLGYDQIIPYFCEEHTRKTGAATTLKLYHEFAGTGIPAGWQLLAACVSQEVIEYSSTTKWTQKTLE